MKKDNSTLERKVALRSRFLLELKVQPVVLETHGGMGKIFQRCYTHVTQGIVFEENPEKTAILALQRPTWAVYECDSERALGAGVGSHLEVNVLDVDPYGQPWPTIDAFFGSPRPFAPKLVVVVNDGLRQKVSLTGGWDVRCLEPMVERHGNAWIFENYLSVCQEMMADRAKRAGYVLAKWTGYYCGHGNQMTHYGAVLDRVE